MENVALVIEDKPSSKQKEKLNSRGLLFGLYQGVPQPKRNQAYGKGALPDKITVFKDSIEKRFDKDQDIKEKVKQWFGTKWLIISVLTKPKCENWKNKGFNSFNLIKLCLINLKKMKQLKDLKASMDKEDATVEKKGVKVTVNGSMKVKSVELNSELSLDEQQDLVKQCINEAFKKVQQESSPKDVSTAIKWT